MNTGLIFDFDGVIAMLDIARFNTLRQECAKHGLEMKEEHQRFIIGKTSEEVLSALFPEASAETLAQIMTDFRTEHRANIEERAIPVQLTVDFIRNYDGKRKLAIASTNIRSNMDRILAHYGIADKFSVIVARGEVSKLKPDPECYLKAAEALGVEPQDCIVIEDTAFGATAALAAGMPCYIVRNQFNDPSDFTGMDIAGFLETPGDMKNPDLY